MKEEETIKRQEALVMLNRTCNLQCGCCKDLKGGGDHRDVVIRYDTSSVCERLVEAYDLSFLSPLLSAGFT